MIYFGFLYVAACELHSSMKTSFALVVSVDTGVSSTPPAVGGLQLKQLSFRDLLGLKWALLSFLYYCYFNDTRCVALFWLKLCPGLYCGLCQHRFSFKNASWQWNITTLFKSFVISNFVDPLFIDYTQSNYKLTKF